MYIYIYVYIYMYIYVHMLCVYKYPSAWNIQNIKKNGGELSIPISSLTFSPAQVHRLRSWDFLRSCLDGGYNL